jgi:hypothetical protein
MGNAEQPEIESPAGDGAALARGWLQSSRFVSHLGITVDFLAPARGQGVIADARGPWREQRPLLL